MEYRRGIHLVTALGLLLAVLFPVFAAAAPPQVGDPAPALGLEKLLHAPEGAKVDWQSLRGKVVVLEFWATWCGPCVQVIPFLNKLEDGYKDKPVQFISITDEREPVIRTFLDKNPIHGWVGLDTDGSIFETYGVSSRPTTVVVDQQGQVVGYTSPYALIDHSDILDDLLAGRPRKLSGPPNQQDPDVLTELGLDVAQLAEADRNQPLCLIVIRPTQPVERKLQSGSGRKSFDRALTLDRILIKTYGVPKPRIISTIPFSEDKRYDIIFSWPEGDLKLGRTLLRQAIEATFGLRVRREKRTMDVYVLTVSDGATPSLERAMSRVFYDSETDHTAPTSEALERVNAGETFFWAMGDTERLAKHLSQTLDRPVVDEAGIEGYYLFWFPYDFGNPDREWLIRKVEEKYGLKLTLAKREIEVLIVEGGPEPLPSVETGSD